MPWFIRLAVVVLLGTGLEAAPVPAFAGTDQPPGMIAAVVARVQDSVMRIVVVHPPEPRPPGEKTMAKAGDAHPVTRIGSGFVIDPDGLIATNRHVVDNSIAIFVATPDGGRFRAEVVGMPVKADIALLRIHAGYKLPAIKW